MRVKDKNLYHFLGSLKNSIVRGSLRKTNVYGGIAKKGGRLAQFEDLRVGLAKNRRVVFLREVYTSMQKIVLILHVISFLQIMTEPNIRDG